MTSTACCCSAVRGPRSPAASSALNPLIFVSGVRSSCETFEMKLPFKPVQLGQLAVGQFELPRPVGHPLFELGVDGPQRALKLLHLLDAGEFELLARHHAHLEQHLAERFPHPGARQLPLAAERGVELDRT